MKNNDKKRIRIVIQEFSKGKYKKNTSRNISIIDSNTSVDEIQNIIINALAKYVIKYKNNQ